MRKSMRFKNLESISECERGKIIRHKNLISESLVITANYGDYAIAVRTTSITNPIEWEIETERP